MRLFSCPSCGATAFFTNMVCAACGATLTFDPGAGIVADATPCANRERLGCNWVAAPEGELCASCAVTRTIPDLDANDNLALWREAEFAKRRVMAMLMRWGLFTPDDTHPAPVFDLLSEETANGEAVVTMGHLDGVLTINVAEADPAVREARRAELDERFRTMVGHFRHEIGHFVFARLVDVDGFPEAFRALFGDEREDYGAALKRHYAEGPKAGWREAHLTAYASAHPHEDWAETFAHLLHLVDIVDSAAAAGLSSPSLSAAGRGFDAYAQTEQEPLLSIAAEFGVALNHVNRGIGLYDVYPFVMTPLTREKLGFALSWVRNAGATAPRAPSRAAGAGAVRGASRSCRRRSCGP